MLAYTGAVMNDNEILHHAEWRPRTRHDCSPVSDSWSPSPSPDYSRTNPTRNITPLPYGLAYDYSKKSPSRSPDSYGSLHSLATSLPDLHHYYNSAKPLPRPDEFLFACRSDSPLDMYPGDPMEQSPQSTFEELHDNPPLMEPSQDPQSPETPQPTAAKTVVPKAHEVPPECHSRHSELTPNLDFLRKLQQEALPPKVPETSPVAPNHPPFRVLAPRPRHILPSTARTLKRPDPLSLGLSGHMTDPKVSPARSLFEKGTQSLDSTGNPLALNVARQRNTKEPRKPSLACVFCRERKIACGRPPSDSEDQTCNQCLRRSFKCEYKNEPSRRSSGDAPSRK